MHYVLSVEISDGKNAHVVKYEVVQYGQTTWG